MSVSSYFAVTGALPDSKSDSYSYSSSTSPSTSSSALPDSKLDSYSSSTSSSTSPSSSIKSPLAVYPTRRTLLVRRRLVVRRGVGDEGAGVGGEGASEGSNLLMVSLPQSNIPEILTNPNALV